MGKTGLPQNFLKYYPPLPEILKITYIYFYNLEYISSALLKMFELTPFSPKPKKKNHKPKNFDLPWGNYSMHVNALKIAFIFFRIFIN